MLHCKLVTVVDKMLVTDWIPDLKRATYGEVGWITPSHEIVMVKHMEHIEWLKNVPELFYDYIAYESELESNAEWMNSELDSLADDEHPAMHRFCGMDDNARDKLLLAAYRLGYIRFGYYNANRYNKNNTNIFYIVELNGVSEYLNKLTKYWINLSKELPMSVAYYHAKPAKNRSYAAFDLHREDIVKGLYNA